MSNLTQYWTDIKTLVDKHAPNAVNDSGLKKTIDLINELVPKGKSLETYTKPWHVPGLMGVGNGLKKQAEGLGTNSVPDVSSDALLAFAREYLALLQKFEQYTPNTTSLIKMGLNVAAAEVKAQAAALDAKIKAYENLKQTIVVKSAELAVLEAEQAVDLAQIAAPAPQPLTQKELLLKEQADLENELKALKQKLKQKEEETQPKLTKAASFENRLQAFLESDPYLPVLDYDQESLHVIYDDLKPLLTPKERAQWDENEKLLSWGLKGTTQYLYSYFSSKAKQPVQDVDLFSQLASNYQGRVKGEVKGELDPIKGQIAAVEAKLTPIYIAISLGDAEEKAANQKLPVVKSELPVVVVARQDKIDKLKAELKQLGKMFQGLFNQVVSSINTLIKDTVKITNKFEENAYDVVLNQPWSQAGEPPLEKPLQLEEIEDLERTFTFK